MYSAVHPLSPTRDGFREPAQRRKSADIRGRSIQSDILVALLDRPREMRSLVQYNAQFFDALSNYIRETQGEKAWQEFEAILFSPREEISDRDWMGAISVFLANNPVFLTKFKESVGYNEQDEDEADDEDEEDTSSDAGSLFSGETTPPSRRSSAAGPYYNYQQQQRRGSTLVSDLLILRDHPDIQDNLQYSCPAFFRKAKQLMSLAPSSSKLCNAARRNSILEEGPSGYVVDYDEPRFDVSDDAYDRFVEVVTTPRWRQPDDREWASEVLDSLEGWPELLDDLRDIASSLNESDVDRDTHAYVS